jgi:Na+(H+)/acetate symporter ActP
VVSFFGAPEDQAVAAAIVVHAIAFMPVLVLGLIFMAQDGLSFGSLKTLAGTVREEKQQEEKQEEMRSDEVPVLRTSRR